MSSLHWDSIICGYCAIRIFKLLLSKNLHGTRTFNAQDHFAVAIVKAETTVGHVPHKCLLFDHFPIPLNFASQV